MTDKLSGHDSPATPVARGHLFLTMVLPSAVIPVAAAVLFDLYLAGWRWAHEPFHALLEAVGSLAAIFLAIFILIMRRNGQLRPGYLWVATTLIGMGLLDGFHAGVHPGPVFVWLHSLATLVGGLTFALVVLPERISSLPILRVAPYLMAATCMLLGIGSVLLPEFIPAMVADGNFTLTAKALNFAGGTGFIVAWVHFARTRDYEDAEERLLLANHCLLFGVAALLFHFSALWDATWWLWHILRLFAYLVILWFFLRIFHHDMELIRQNRDELRLRGEELERIQSRLHDIIEHSPSAITLKDTAGRFVLVNRRFQEMFGLARALVIGKTATEVMTPEVAELFRAGDEATLQGLKTIEAEETLPLAGGKRTFLSARFPLDNPVDGIYGIGCIQTDITARKLAEDDLRLAQKIFEHSSEAILVTDPQGRIIAVNDAYVSITGYARDEVIGQNPGITNSGRHDKEFYRGMWTDLIEKGQWAGEIWDRRKSGEIYPKWLSINTISNTRGETTHYVGVFSDITERKNAEEQIRHLAHHDKLTGLLNRHSLQERLDQALASAQRYHSPLAVMFIDMDRFKIINDTLGHHVGDQLLVAIAARLRASLRDSDIVARLGGDEFVVVLIGMEASFDVLPVSGKILKALSLAYEVDGHALHSTPSIGISVFPGDGNNAEELMKNADTAMYHAKAQGRNNVQFFTAAMNAAAAERMELERDLRTALDANQMELHYQMQVHALSGEPSGLEALLRWRHPERGMISPLQFIPIAEESGLIESLGNWVLATACQQISVWRGLGIPGLRMAVNLSAHQLRSTALVEQIEAIIRQHGILPGELELEVTESVAMSDPEQAISRLQALRNLGVQLSIDDFGTGYSSLAYLRQLPVHCLKIDRSFVKDIESDENDAAICASILALAHSIGLEVVAEGVESEEQRKFLVDHGCNYLQGYYFAKPEPAEECLQRLQQARTRSPDMTSCSSATS